MRVGTCLASGIPLPCRFPGTYLRNTSLMNSSRSFHDLLPSIVTHDLNPLSTVHFDISFAPFH